MKDEYVSIKKKFRKFSIRAFLSMFLLLMLIGAIPGLFYGGHFSIDTVIKNASWFFTYWFVITLAFSLITTYQKYKSYDKPIAELSEATKKVALGDFSVFVDPKIVHNRNPYFKRMIKDFNSMVEELGSVETLKTDFVSSVSHELKTPLAVIQNYATVLKQDAISQQEKNDYLDEIINASSDLAVTVSNILLLNKLDNQGSISDAATFNLVEQLSDVLLSFENLLEEKNLEVHVELEDRAIVHFDANMLGIVWRNLLSNAIKFSDENGKLFLSQYSTNKEIIVSIRDSGIGMDQKTLSHLFDKFYQADTSRAQQGNGLGLALVKRVVELIDGSITYSSTLGEGTEFIVSIPLK